MQKQIEYNTLLSGFETGGRLSCVCAARVVLQDGTAAAMELLEDYAGHDENEADDGGG